MTSTPLPDETWLLTDGHAGNLRQAAALAQALACGRVRDVRLAPSWPARLLSPRRFPGAATALGAAFADASRTPPALAIGCGRQGALATRLLRARGSRVVQVLDPRIDPAHWDIVVVPEHDGLHGANVVTLQGSLHPVDAAWLAGALEAFAPFAALPEPRTALLVGGASAHLAMTSGDVAAFLQWLHDRIAGEGGSVLATSSRRTPPAVRALLHAHLEDLPGVVWTGDDDGPNPYPGLLAWADRIVCSADSVNMLSEAAATTAPLYIAGADRVTGRPRRFLDALIASGRARPCLETLSPYAATPLRETPRVAADVAMRLRRLR